MEVTAPCRCWQGRTSSHSPRQYLRQRKAPLLPGAGLPRPQTPAVSEDAAQGRSPWKPSARSHRELRVESVRRLSAGAGGRARRGPSAPYLGSLFHVVLAEPAAAVHHQSVYQSEEKVDGLAALLSTPNPLDLVATEMPLGDAAAGAGQLPVGQLPVAVHPLHPLQHAVSHHLSQKVVQVTEADVM